MSNVTASPSAISKTVVTAQKPAPRASVIVVNHNGGEYLRQCLESLGPVCHHTDEIILVDNASTDGSVSGVPQAFPDVRLIRSPVNLGFGGGNNLGVRWASGDYLAFLNPDTVVTPGWLTALVEALEADPTIGLATSQILLMGDPERINACGNDIHCTGLTLCRGMGLDHTTMPDSTEVSAVSGAAFLIRREVFESLGGFDEPFFLYMEDTDLSLRARLAGYRCVYVPTSVVYHRYTLRFGPRKIFYQERNRYLMLLKALRWRTLLVLFPALLLAEVVTWGLVLLRERRRLTEKVWAYAWIVQHWRDVVERRRQTQSIRRIRDRELIALFSHRLAYEQTVDGFTSRLAHVVFDPLYYAFLRMALLVTRW